MIHLTLKVRRRAALSLPFLDKRFEFFRVDPREIPRVDEEFLWRRALPRIDQERRSMTTFPGIDQGLRTHERDPGDGNECGQASLFLRDARMELSIPKKDFPPPSR